MEEAPPTPSRWLVSPRFDLAIVAIPLALALAALVGIHVFEVAQPLWAYLVFYVAFDVAHVWSTIYITYLDREAFARRKMLYTLSVPVCFGVAFGLHLISPTLFWTALAYFAIYHFAKQQYGFVAIYKGKAGERERLDYVLDKVALWAGTLGPVLMWHATPGATFDWFESGEAFAFRLPEATLPFLYIAWGVIGALYVGRQLQVAAKGGGFNVGKNVWMGATWLSWYVGVRLTDHLFVSAAFLNILHGLPYMALVWHRSRARWKGARPEGGAARLLARVTRPGYAALFYGIVFGIALVEEALWDGVVWGKYLAPLTGLAAPELEAVGLAFWVALLSLPQIVHYLLDGFLWKLTPENPDWKAALFGRPKDQGTTQ